MVENTKSALHRIWKQVISNYNAIALASEGRDFTYEEINRLSNKLARYLISNGVSQNVLVGLYLDHSPQTLISILGVWKAGGAFLPIDTHWPIGRAKTILKESSAMMVLTTAGYSSRLMGSVSIVTEICFDSKSNWVNREIRNQCGSNLPEAAESTLSEEHAYVIYTSGSTGTPKGVVVEHKAFSNFLCSAHQQLLFDGFGDPPSWLAMTPYSFDISLLELFLPLYCGGKVVLGSGDWLKEARNLSQIIDRYGVTAVQATPSTWKLISELGWRGAGRLDILVGGEYIPENIAHYLIENGGRVWNCYGPTEATIWSHMRYIRGLSSLHNQVSHSVIGGCLAHYQQYVITDGALAGEGEIGELYLGGKSLAHSYLNNEALTAAKFVHMPFINNSKTRVYKTGDIVRLLPGGNLEYLGRTDDQVKMRGFRVELGEIEHHTVEHHLVSDCKVMLRSNGSGIKSMVAYIVFEKEGLGPMLKIEYLCSVRNHLELRIPSYMIPGSFVVLNRLPLARNGKIDRLALESMGEEITLKNEYASPQGVSEACIKRIFEGVLNVGDIGVLDNFFTLGGCSIQAAQVVARINANCNASLSVDVIFRCPTIRSLSANVFSSNSCEFPGIELKSIPRNVPVLASLEQEASLEAKVKRRVTGNTKRSHINEPIALLLEGRLNINVLERSLHYLVDRHHVLQYRFKLIDGRHYISSVKLRGESIIAQHSLIENLGAGQSMLDSLQDLAYELIDRPFDFYNGPLCRFHLIRCLPEKHVFILDWDHIICDGWSAAIFTHELKVAYNAFLEGLSPKLNALPIQFRDFAHWQRQWYKSEAFQKQKDYWRCKYEQFATKKMVDIPTDFPKNNKKVTRASCYDLSLGCDLVDNLLSVSRVKGVTLFTLLLAGYAISISRQWEMCDILLTTVSAERNRPELESIIGNFVADMSIFISITGETNVGDVIKQVSQKLIEARTNCEVPIRVMQRELGLDQESLPAGALLNYSDFKVRDSVDMKDIELAPLAVSDPNRYSSDGVKLFMFKNFSNVSGKVYCDCALYRRETIESLINYYKDSLELLSDNSKDDVVLKEWYLQSSASALT